MKDFIHVLVAGADSAFLPKTLDVQDVIPMNIELAVEEGFFGSKDEWLEEIRNISINN